MSSTSSSYAKRTREQITGETVVTALVGGFVFAIATLWVYATIRQQSIVTIFEPTEPMGLLVAIYITGGLILLGGIPIALLWSRRRYTPILVVTIVLGWGFYRTWHALESAREIGADPGVTLRLDTVILFGWVLVLGCSLLAGWIETYGRERRSS